MRNPISATYRLFDDSLMAGANYAVHAYNWTTGGTKDELANNMVTGGAILLSAGDLLKGFPYMVPLVLFWAHILQKSNERDARLENHAIKNGMLNMEVEYSKKIDKLAGPIFYFFSADDLIRSNYSENKTYQISEQIRSLGWIISGSSFYIMRTDPLPPRKNVFSRMADRASELFEEYRKPALQPTS